MKLPESLIKQHKLEGASYLNKPEMIKMLVENGHLPESELPKEKKPVEVNAENIIKYSHLKEIRNNPIRVEILDTDTNEVTAYSSMYKAARVYKTSAKTMRLFNGKVWRQRYEIKIFEKI